MDYGAVLSRAWEITWRWKVLWILGFLAALGNGVSTGNPSYTMDTSDWGYTFHRPWIPPRIIALLIGIACLVLFIGIALWVLSVIARGGLIAGVQQVEDGGMCNPNRWCPSCRRDCQWRTLAASSAGFSGPPRGLGIAGAILFGGVFCGGAVLLAIVLAQIRIYAERAAILEDLDWIEAFKRGWQVLKENLGPTILFWLIFLAIGLVFVGGVVASLAAVLAPFIAIFSRMQPGFWLAVPLCFGGLLGALLFALLGSIVETFGSATWTLAYRELTGLAAASATQLEAEPAAE
ncbi:MAG: hypothetical protein P8189_14305 [Anaerolineae bacterium]